ncbi:hypothetical protein [Microbacterium panaciterrae]|uniref:Antitoxin Xre/MbcA/ParS-like toxin-binding domain-containing protein n=1 Tax=Microbacterium panaciterrae TaxID=985759 RepID=A0ABP8P6G0_9MICO
MRKRSPYSFEAVCEALDTTSEQLLDHIAQLKILWIASNGRQLSPLFAFGPGPSPVPDLADVLKLLTEIVDDPWTWAQYVAAKPHGRSAIEGLLSGDVDAVVSHARTVASAWNA